MRVHVCHRLVDHVCCGLGRAGEPEAGPRPEGGRPPAPRADVCRHADGPGGAHSAAAVAAAAASTRRRRRWRRGGGWRRRNRYGPDSHPSPGAGACICARRSEVKLDACTHPRTRAHARALAGAHHRRGPCTAPGRFRVAKRGGVGGGAGRTAASGQDVVGLAAAPRRGSGGGAAVPLAGCGR